MSYIHVWTIVALLIMSIIFNARHFAKKHYEGKMTEEQAGKTENRYIVILIFIAVDPRSI